MLAAIVKACLANQRFQENDTLRPDWRLVLAHQAIPKLLKITLDGPYYEAIDLIVKAIYQRVNLKILPTHVLYHYCPLYLKFAKDLHSLNLGIS